MIEPFIYEVTEFRIYLFKGKSQITHYEECDTKSNSHVYIVLLSKTTQCSIEKTRLRVAMINNELMSG